MTMTELTRDTEPDQMRPGTLIVTDAQLLVRPAPEGQYHYLSAHDTVRAYQILDLAADMGAYNVHIVTTLVPQMAYRLLGRNNGNVFSTYAEDCYAQLDCELFVYYYDRDNNFVYKHEYGIHNGAYTMHFYVHCDCPPERTDTLVQQIAGEGYQDEPLIVVRPDSSELGYTTTWHATPGEYNTVPEHIQKQQLAHELADYILSNATGALGIEIFGSIARNEATADSDYDFIVMVDEFAARHWMNRINELLWEASVDVYNSAKAKDFRFAEAMKILGLNAATMEATFGIEPGQIDLFVFPTNWRTRLTMLQQVGHHHDRNFMRNLAHDALAYDLSKLGFPFPPTQPTKEV